MEIENWEQIDDDMQRGYSYSMNDENVLACNEWKKTWEAVISAMDSGGFGSIEEFDEAFSGLECVYNWASDYETELMNAIGEDISFAKDRISFSTGYLDRIADKCGQNSLNKRVAIANSYFLLGMTDEGEKLYKALSDEYPAWGWGWISWSDEYVDNRGYSKAIDLLKTALTVDGVSDIPAIKDRLKAVYKACGMHEEADSVVIDEWDYGVPLSEIENVAGVLKNDMETVINEIFGNSEQRRKIGRNEPCPCGSGKKYKKCCGLNK